MDRRSGFTYVEFKASLENDKCFRAKWKSSWKDGALKQVSMHSDFSYDAYKKAIKLTT